MADSKSLSSGIDYSYVDRMVANIRNSLMITQPEMPYEKGVLLSIHLQSNRPDNFTQFLDDLEASIDDPANIEVVVKIDDVDGPMNELLPKEVARRPFTVKYLSTPLDGGFFELWRSMNDILDVSDPNAYFLWNMNDEMAVLNKGWDTALKKYVGLFPDHIFRLRTSLFRARNYCDFWENGFAPETSAITTRRWIEIGGNWNPCLGPDSFQQCVAYYFAYHDRFNKHKPMREMPIHDLTFNGEGAFLGLEGDKLWKRMRGATKAWFHLMSHEIQTDASRRAQKLHAHICAYDNRLNDFEVMDDPRKQRVVLINKEDNRVIREFSYKLPNLRYKCTNFFRSFYYLYYAGGGQRARWPLPISLMKFLSLRYDSFEWMYYSLKYYSDNKPKAQIYVVQRARAMQRTLQRKSMFIYSYLEAMAKVLPRPLLHVLVAACAIIVWPFKVMQAKLHDLLAFVLNRGYPLNIALSPYNKIACTINWIKVDSVLTHIIFPERYMNSRYRTASLRGLLLAHWYGLTSESVLEEAKQNMEFRYFMGIRRTGALPAASALRVLKDILIERDALNIFYDVASHGVDFSTLPPLKYVGMNKPLPDIAA